MSCIGRKDLSGGGRWRQRWRRGGHGRGSDGRPCHRRRAIPCSSVEDRVRPAGRIGCRLQPGRDREAAKPQARAARSAADHPPAHPGLRQTHVAEKVKAERATLGADLSGGVLLEEDRLEPLDPCGPDPSTHAGTSTPRAASSWCFQASDVLWAPRALQGSGTGSVSHVGPSAVRLAIHERAVLEPQRRVIPLVREHDQIC